MLGTAEVRFVYLEGEEPWLLEGTAVTTNEGGSWEGTFRLRQAGELGSEEYETFHEGVGRGACEGLQYTGIARDTGDPNGGGHTSVSNFTISPITP